MAKDDVGALEHYERMIREIDDPDHPVCDPFCAGFVKDWQSRWDALAFYEALGDVRDKDVLEIGVGTGRVAKNVLDLGCARLVGIDISPSTIERARSNLSDYQNVELVVAAIESFRRDISFDVAYSVLTFMHVEHKRTALSNIVASLRFGGHLALSVSYDGDWLDYGSRRVKLFPAAAEEYATWLKRLGCEVAPPVNLVDSFVYADGKKSCRYGEVFSSVIKATKRTATHR